MREERAVVLLMRKASPGRSLFHRSSGPSPLSTGEAGPRTALPRAGLLGGTIGVSVLGPETQIPVTCHLMLGRAGSGVGAPGQSGGRVTRSQEERDPREGEPKRHETHRHVCNTGVSHGRGR